MSTAAFPLTFGTASLLRRQLTAGKQLPEMTALLRERFSPNRLRVLGPPGDFRPALYSAEFGGMQVSTLAYNTAIELEVETTGDHLLVTTQLEGEEFVRSQGQSGSGRVGFVVIDSTPEPVTKRFSADSHRLNLRVGRPALEALWQRATGEAGVAPQVFAPFVASAEGRRRWWAHMQLLLGYVEAPPALLAGDPMRRHIEEAVMLFLLLEHPHDASHLLARAVEAAGDRRLVRAEDFIRAHLRDPLSLAGIAEAAGISIRSLTAAFRARHRTSPMKFIEGLRLDAAHAMLAHGQRSVTEVAVELGFSNLGRFAAAYRRRFGVAPSRTLARFDRH
jgi:AraC-like DNA-binding protein